MNEAENMGERPDLSGLFPVDMKTGWVCPKCGAVYAPNVSACKKCTPIQKEDRSGDNKELLID